MVTAGSSLRNESRGLLEDFVLLVVPDRSTDPAETGLLRGMPTDFVPLRDGRPQPTIEGNGPGVSHGRPAEFAAPAAPGQLRSDPDRHVDHVVVRWGARDAGGAADAAESQQDVVAVDDGPVPLVGFRRFEGVLDVPGTRPTPAGQVQPVFDGELPYPERGHRICNGGRSAGGGVRSLRRGFRTGAGRGRRCWAGGPGLAGCRGR